jgi:hypothetical protein
MTWIDRGDLRRNWRWNHFNNVINVWYLSVIEWKRMKDIRSRQTHTEIKVQGAGHKSRPIKVELG